MDMLLNEEHLMVRESIRRFAEEEIKPLAQELDAKEEFSVELTQKMGEMGLFGMTIDPAYGGHGFKLIAVHPADDQHMGTILLAFDGLVLEFYGRRNNPTPLMTTDATLQC